MKKYVVPFLIIACCYSGLYPKKETGLKAGLQIVLDQIAEYEEIPGVTFSMLKKGGIQVDLAAGYADLENRVRMRPGDIMFSGSIGKTYAAAVVLQLAEEGKISLDDPVLKFFMEEKWIRRVPNITKISVRMLLNHTTGIPRYAFHSSVWEEIKNDPDKVWSGRNVLRRCLI